MNIFNRLSLISLALLCIMAVLFSCENSNLPKGQNKEGNETATVNIPKLIQRGEKIQLGKEWDFTQNFYNDQKSLIAENPSNPEAHLKLAELFIKEARITGEHGHYYPAALEMVNKVIELEDSNQDLKFRALMTKAGVQLSLHEFSDALETGESALALNANNAQIYGVLVDCYVELGEYEKAIKAADRMISIKPDIRSYSRVSYLREIHGDVPGAKKALKLAIESGFPGYEETAWAMLTLGELYNRYGAQDTAKQIFTEILRMREDYPFAISAIGDINYAQGKYEEAEKLQREAIDVIPEVGYYVSLAHIFKDKKRAKELESLMSEIFTMLQEDVDSGHNMNLEYADIYLNLLDNPDKALSYGKLEYDKRPTNIDVNRVLAQIYAAKGEKSLAKKHYEAALTTGSKHPDLSELKNEITE